MDHNDKVLLEQYFTYINMSEDARNCCINYLLHTKDIDGGKVSIGDNKVIRDKFDILTLHLNRKNNIILFDGVTYNSNENRWINGSILKKDKRIIIETNVERLGIIDKEKDYSVIDIFEFDGKRIIRKTAYDSGEESVDEVYLMEFDQVEEYLQNKVDVMKKRR